MRALLAALLIAAPGLAWAEGHAVTIRNGGGETIHGIYFDGGGSSRLLHDLPQGAVARITYSSRCQTSIRIAYASGRTEEHPGVDACTDPQITAGTDGVAGASVAPEAKSNGTAGPRLITTVAPGDKAAVKPGAKPGAGHAAKLGTVVRETPPEVPPWTGKSITKRFGGME